MIIDAIQYDGLCICGRKHTMSTRFCVIEAGCLRNLETYMTEYGLCGYRTAVYDANTYAAIGDRRPVMDQEIVLDPAGLHADETGVATILEQLNDGCKVLVACGSGTIHDLVRYCAHKRAIPFVSCPTAASVDGFCSSVAAMTWEGYKKTFPSISPTIVVADTDIIAAAPARMARAGFGDMVGKYVALAEWRMAHVLTGEFYCSRIAEMMTEAVDAIIRYVPGLAEGNAETYQYLMYGLLLSGIAMQMMGNSRPASGAEHHISHFIEMAPPALGCVSDAMHGEKVGVATLLVSEEYHRLTEAKDCPITDYHPVTQQELYPVFGDRLTRSIEEENENDCAKGITGSQIAACWEEIRSIMQQIPAIEHLTALYDTIGAIHTLSKIGVSETKKELLLRESPCVRNRLTLMRLRRGMK